MAGSMKFKALLAGMCLMGFVSGAQAVPLGTYDDSVAATSYWGGNESNGSNVEVLGTPTVFGIDNMVVSRIGDSLNVVINTFYSGTNIGSISTNLGSLFLGTLPVTFNGSGAAPNYKEDTYTNSSAVVANLRFKHVLDFDTTPLTGVASEDGTGEASLYSIAAKSDVVVSAGAGKREGQAIDVTDARKNAAGSLVSAGNNWSQVGGVGPLPGSITFNIVNFFGAGGLGATGAIYESGVLLAWAMTCANDVIYARVPLSGSGTGEVPLPAGIILLFSGLFGLGFLSRLKSRTSKALA